MCVKHATYDTVIPTGVARGVWLTQYGTLGTKCHTQRDIHVTTLSEDETA